MRSHAPAADDRRRSIGLVVLAAVPLAVAAIARPDGRSLADSYLVAVAIIATIQLGAIGWLGVLSALVRHRPDGQMKFR